MKYKIECPNCHRKYVVDTSCAGMRADCASCGQEFVLPRVSSASVVNPSFSRRQNISTTKLAICVVVFSMVIGVGVYLLVFKPLLARDCADSSESEINHSDDRLSSMQSKQAKQIREVKPPKMQPQRKRQSGFDMMRKEREMANRIVDAVIGPQRDLAGAIEAAGSFLNLIERVKLKIGPLEFYEGELRIIAEDARKVLPKYIDDVDRICVDVDSWIPARDRMASRGFFVGPQIQAPLQSALPPGCHTVFRNGSEYNIINELDQIRKRCAKYRADLDQRELAEDRVENDRKRMLMEKHVKAEQMEFESRLRDFNLFKQKLVDEIVAVRKEINELLDKNKIGHEKLYENYYQEIPGDVPQFNFKGKREKREISSAYEKLRQWYDKTKPQVQTKLKWVKAYLR